MTFQIRRASFGSTFDAPLVTRETVEMDTLASRATSWISRPKALAVAARIELGLHAFLNEGGFGAFTDTFEDLYGLDQLPGITVQRLMAAGFGFAGEGDWNVTHTETPNKQAQSNRRLKATLQKLDMLPPEDVLIKRFLYIAGL
jgi:hypothetical protein